jgi:MacB-like periplasmic core domain
MEKLLQDIRYGARSILKAPRFTVAAVLTLALGIGANTAMFSVIRSVLMRSWPFPNPGRLLLVSQRQANGNSNLFSTQDYLDWGPNAVTAYLLQQSGPQLSQKASSLKLLRQITR